MEARLSAAYRAFEDNHHTDHWMTIDLRVPLDPPAVYDETQMIPTIVVRHWIRKRLLYAEANDCCVALYYAGGYTRGVHTCILQPLVQEVLFHAYDNTCIRMNMTSLSFARIDCREVPTSLSTCELLNPNEQMSSFRSSLICSDNHEDEINTTNTLVDIKLPHTLEEVGGSNISTPMVGMSEWLAQCTCAVCSVSLFALLSFLSQGC